MEVIATRHRHAGRRHGHLRAPARRLGSTTAGSPIAEGSRVANFARKIFAKLFDGSAPIDGAATVSAGEWLVAVVALAIIVAGINYLIDRED